MSFTSDLKKFQKKVNKAHRFVKRESALDLFSSIVLETPVDKGVLRGNWFADIGKPSSQVSEASDAAGGVTVAKIESVLSTGGETRDFFLTNNLPYAVPIEFDGHSGKAPEGMVRVNVARWDAIVKANIRKARNAR